MASNLLDPRWVESGSYELRHLLGEQFGLFGQYDGFAENPNVIHLPGAGPACQIRLVFRGQDIVAIEQGPAFDAIRWSGFAEHADRSLLSEAVCIAREHSFHWLQVYGTWRGERSGVQMLPAPADWPRPNVEIAAHAFVLEYPIRYSEDSPTLNYRRRQNNRLLIRLLDVLLRGHTWCLPSPGRSEHLWVVLHQRGAHLTHEWAQPAYFVDLGNLTQSYLSTAHGETLELIDPETYYSERGPLSIRACVPTDLDYSIVCYQNLSAANRRRFDRATYWFTMASRQWYVSISASFAALVSSVESLTVRGEQHSYACPECGQQTTHEVPGPTKRFREFFEAFAPEIGAKKDRDRMYALRSSILHGSELMQIDEETQFGWDPPMSKQRELHEALWRLMRIALRNWLRHHGRPTTEDRVAIADSD